MLQFLDIFFFVFHTAFMVFNCVGWIWKTTRPWHLATIMLTALSWFVLGIWFGWGYCVCTDWHYQVRDQLGYTEDSRTYTHMLFEEITGVRAAARLADIVTVSVFTLTALLSITLNIRDFRNRSVANRGATKTV